ncbi:MAG: threonine ammonia-lyase [Deltaproteobacteria bacterium]|nr:threonine ammonia-lyase [Deltaproteobacteria bacterium]MBI4795689.1 threonine ammonia-lyase [Deltaproteobacteria bacterium]
MSISLSDIEAAQVRLRGVALRTPLVYSRTLSRVSGLEVFLKLENLQTTGSFKLRGALNRLKLLKERGEGARVVAASAGNHAQGVAFAAASLQIPATIVMPQGASISKQMATRSYGAEVILHGRDLSEALERARELVAQGYIFIHPYDDPEVMAGQGTLGLEILEDLPGVDTVVIPVGGGGLAAGTALALKARKPRVAVIGVQAAQVPSLAAALEKGEPTPVPARPTLADGIRVPLVGGRTFPMLKELLQEVVLVEEMEIAQALLFLLEGKKVLAEGAGAAATAAFLGPLKDRDLGKQVVLVVSGGNIDIPLLERVLPRALLERRRLWSLRVTLSDRPGALGRLAGLLGEQGANILHLFHDRLAPELPLDYTRVELNLETRDREHGEAVLQALRDAGYEVEEKP